MSFPETRNRFGDLLDFLCQYKGQLLDDPYRGNLETIRVFYQLQYPDKKDSRAENLKRFSKYLDEFNMVSANALEFSTDGHKRLTWIKKANLDLLQNRLSDSEQPEKATDIVVKYTNPNLKEPVHNALIQMLNSSLYTTSCVEAEQENGFDFDLDRLNDILNKPTAMEQLGTHRAKLQSTQKAFFEVCESAAHNQTLAKLCLSSKTLGQGSNDLPSNTKIHKVIASCKSLINKEILTCVKSKIHFLPLLTSHTDSYLGNCSYLDTCHKLKNCRYLHFYTLNPLQAESQQDSKPLLALDYTVGECYDTITKKQLPPQWINCDVRYLPFNILGKFAAIISDPAWDIHMSLPYGTCKDSELLSLPMRELQDEGILMLWVTGRSIEIGRKALAQWGYSISDEMIWIKLNQLRRTIVTGRTGHWFNHSKEHLIVGVKGNPIWLNKKIDIDFIVSGTRETSRKPDELYGIVERLVGKDARKLEIFGRDNNIRPGWLTIGNQVTGTSLYEEEVLQNYNKYQAQKNRR